MSSSKHTPGPWKVIGSVHRLPGGGTFEVSVAANPPFGSKIHTPVAKVWDSSDGDLVLANARLIAAAPDLAKWIREVAVPALKDAIEAIESEYCSHGDEGSGSNSKCYAQKQYAALEQLPKDSE